MEMERFAWMRYEDVCNVLDHFELICCIYRAQFRPLWEYLSV